MLTALYTLLLSCAALAALPLLPVLVLLPRVRKGLGERLGLLPRAVREQAWMGEGCLWVHAASLGEVNAVAPVVRELAARLPRHPLLVTCTTPVGREQARRVFPQAAACLLLPLDLPFLLEPWMRRFRPRLAVVAETEWWPNFLRCLKRHGAQILVANGRLTERSLRRYVRLRPLFAAAVERVDLFAMQSEEDAARVAALGVRPARVVVTGNTKFDLSADLEEARARSGALRRELGWAAQAPVVVAGSTRPGEEALLLEAFAGLRKALPEARLVLAPRHLERLPEVEKVLDGAARRWVRRSAGVPAGDAEVLLLDTLGELRAFYGLAERAGAAWVGGSFRDFGGQNPLEPAALGVPVFFGPHMRHFGEVARVLLKGGGARQVPAGELGKATAALLADPRAREAQARAAEETVRSHSGASRATADLAWKLLLVARLVGQGQGWRGEGLASFRAVSETGGGTEDPGWRDEDLKPFHRGGEFGMGLGRERERGGAPD